MDLTAEYESKVFNAGFAVVDDVLTPDDVAHLRRIIAAIPEGEEVRKRASVYGVRNLLQVSDGVKQLAGSNEIRAWVTPILGHDCFAVRATFFDKVPDANWNLRWHQDGVISVREQVETPGFSAWSNKAGTTQVRPPESILQKMVAIRVHLDDCPASNGALKVLAGSHRKRWERDEIPTCKEMFDQHVCEVRAGGILAMRPLLLHASSASESPDHRRVIHIEFATGELPGELDWNLRIGAKSQV